MIRKRLLKIKIGGLYTIQGKVKPYVRLFDPDSLLNWYKNGKVYSKSVALYQDIVDCLILDELTVDYNFGLGSQIELVKILYDGKIFLVMKDEHCFIKIKVENYDESAIKRFFRKPYKILRKYLGATTPDTNTSNDEA